VLGVPDPEGVRVLQGHLLVSGLWVLVPLVLLWVLLWVLLTLVRIRFNFE